MNCTDVKQNKVKICDYALFVLLLTAYTAMTFYLFSRQVYGSEMRYHSDMKAYILEMQGLDSGYSFPYQLFFKFAAFLHLFISAPEMAVAVAVTILNTFSLVVTKYYADKLLLSEVKGYTDKNQLFSYLTVTLLVFSLFFVSMLYTIGGIQLPGIFRRYRGVFTPNPYHNATYLAVRPFAIVTFFVFVRVLRDYEENFNRKDVVLFGSMLFLATVTKPSFTFILVPAAGLIMLYRLFRAKWCNFKQTLFLGLSFVPTFGALLYQYLGVFGPVEGQETGIGLGVGVSWSYHCTNIPLAIVLGMAFPLAVLVLNVKELKKNDLFRFSWQITLVSLFEVLFLYEKGFRIKDVNFSWGYMHGMFFAFVTSAFLLFGKTLNWRNSGIWQKVLLLGQWSIFALHLGLGLLYFKTMLVGELYY